MAPSGEEESPKKKMSKNVTKLLLPLKQRRRRISRALRSLSWGAKKEEPSNEDGGRKENEVSDAETTFVSATSSELRSPSTDVDDDGSEPPSFRLSPPPPIFPTGSIERRLPASPVKIVRRLPFGYVIGRQLDVPATPPSSVTTVAREIKKVAPAAMAALYLRSRSQMVRKKVFRALTEACRRGRREGAEEADDGCGSGGHDDEDVFWKKDVKGLRCRRQMEDDDDEAQEYN
ncbi:hypothetical protein BAE44_0018464 [Dichanthelium oligosanthes]|uniref:Uncharacterized protein n=1 Tax=Dichanthelium oligosanthes TaxID=888268 RepID=A0A1E5V5Y7_9POAL|nr:hypothetical protein BAE44_0018464 [Dichanthelium oligosanthes]